MLIFATVKKYWVFFRMSGKLITDVAKAFSLDVRSKREEAIQNILEFLMKPDDTFLRTSGRYRCNGENHNKNYHFFSPLTL